MMSMLSPTPDPKQQQLDGLFKLIDGIGVCMLTTRRVRDGRLVSRAMRVAQRVHGVDICLVANRQLHDLSDTDLASHEQLVEHEGGAVANLRGDPHVNLAFYRSTTGEWVSVSGLAKVRAADDPDPSRFRSLVKSAWSSQDASWFHGGVGDPALDPRVALIEVETLSATYASISAMRPQTLFDLATSTLTGARVPTTRTEMHRLKSSELIEARQPTPVGNTPPQIHAQGPAHTTSSSQETGGPGIQGAVSMATAVEEHSHGQQHKLSQHAPGSQPSSQPLKPEE